MKLKKSDFEASGAFLKRRAFTNKLASLILFLAAASGVFVTLGIIFVLLRESIPFFQNVSLVRFFTDSQWTPTFEDAQYGIMTLLSATITVAGIALLVAVPAGLALAIYLSEYASKRSKEIIKPFLELLEGIPTVVYGFFALLFVTPLLKLIIPSIEGFNMLSPGIVMGIMILPYTASVSEDAMNAVPMGLREAGYAMGFSKFKVATRVVMPAAVSGITAALILGMSRAIGETMVVAIAAGQSPHFTFNPLEGASTITGYIAQMATGDLPHASIAYQSVFAAGFFLFLITLVFNYLGFRLKRKFREAY